MYFKKVLIQPGDSSAYARCLVLFGLVLHISRRRDFALVTQDDEAKGVAEDANIHRSVAMYGCDSKPGEAL
jgi:hypothetical protein